MSQPDWDAIAGKFDVFLPQLAPVAKVLLDALAVRPGERVIDLASGTGEPALTLARRVPGVHVTGTDAAEGMVRAARRKAAAEGLEVSFEVMPAEHLEFPDASFDKALCRFGVMLFEDPLAGLSEIRRVLRPGGAFAFAVWSRPEMFTTMHWSVRALSGRVPDDLMPPVGKITALGRPGVLDDLLEEAGFRTFELTRRTFEYRFDSFEDYWDMVEASDILRQQWDALSESDRRVVRDEIAAFARDFQTPGGLVVPHEYLLATGSA